jgi:hypothetical protein
MSHNEFEEMMQKIARAQVLTYRAECETYYNVSAQAAEHIRAALRNLEQAAETMGDLYNPNGDSQGDSLTS